MVIIPFYGMFNNQLNLMSLYVVDIKTEQYCDSCKYKRIRLTMGFLKKKITMGTV